MGVEPRKPRLSSAWIIPRRVEERLAATWIRLAKPRLFEANTVFDDADGGLRARGCLLRLREVGDRAIVTFKGQAERSRHKSREELETTHWETREPEPDF